MLSPSPTRPLPAVRRAPRPESPMVCPVFKFDRCVLLDFFITQFRFLPVSYVYLSNPKPGHTTAGRVGAPSGAAGRGRARLGANRIIRPGNKKSTGPSKASKKRRSNVSPEARTSEILCKPTEEQNQRLTLGFSPVYHRFISGTRSALCFLAADQWNDAFLSL